MTSTARPKPLMKSHWAGSLSPLSHCSVSPHSHPNAFIAIRRQAPSRVDAESVARVKPGACEPYPLVYPIACMQRPAEKTAVSTRTARG